MNTVLQKLNVTKYGLSLWQDLGLKIQRLFNQTQAANDCSFSDADYAVSDEIELEYFAGWESAR